MKRTTLSIGIALVVGVLLLRPWTASSELRPLVRDMLENLGSVNLIGEGVALENYALVERAALDMKSRAEKMKDVDIATLGLDPADDTRFDAYLAAQQDAANVIASAAKAKDGQACMLGVQQLFQNACLACHADFREGNQLLRPSVLFMTTFMINWNEMNRGLAINDLALVGRSARELQTLTRVLVWDQVIQTAFEVDDEAKRKSFQRYLRRLEAHAVRIEQASLDDDAHGIVEGTRKMWNEGCLPCHEEFR